MVLNFLDYCYPYDHPDSLDALFQGNGTQTSHSIFVSRLRGTCGKAKSTLTSDERDLLGAHIVNCAVDQALTSLHTESWGLRSLDLSTDEVLDAKRRLLDNDLGNGGVELSPLKIEEAVKRAKLGDGVFVERFVSMNLEHGVGGQEDMGDSTDVAGSGAERSSTSSMGFVSQYHPFIRKIIPMRRNRVIGVGVMQVDA